MGVCREIACKAFLTKGTCSRLHSQRMHALLMQAELKEVRRYLLYCRGLKYKRPDQQRRFWQEHLLLGA